MVRSSTVSCLARFRLAPARRDAGAKRKWLKTKNPRLHDLGFTTLRKFNVPQVHPVAAAAMAIAAACTACRAERPKFVARFVIGFRAAKQPEGNDFNTVANEIETDKMYNIVTPNSREVLQENLYANRTP